MISINGRGETPTTATGLHGSEPITALLINFWLNCEKIKLQMRGKA